MSFREAINSIFGPSKDKLHSTLEEVDKKIEDKDKNGDIRPLQKAINNIREKIKTDNKDNDISPNKRALFKSQLDTLEDMNDAYETYRKVKYTKPTNAELKKLFEGVNSQISETGNNIEDDQERIEEVMKIEKEDHKDGMINTGSKRYRDIVELHTDFEGIRDTFNESDEISAFLKYFTWEYKNIAGAIYKRDADGNIVLDDEDNPIVIGLIPEEEKVNEYLDIDKEQLNDILYKVGTKIKKSDLKMKFTLKNGEEKVIDFNEYTQDYRQSKEVREKIDVYKSPLEKLSNLGFIDPKELRDLSKQQDSLEKLKKVLEKLKNGFKKEISNYQIAKGLIKDENSEGAGEISSELSKNNINLSHKLWESAKSTYTGEVSTKLLEEEYKEGFRLGEFIRDNGLPESTQKLALDLIKRELKGKNIRYQNKTGILEDYTFPETISQEQGEKFISNLSVLMRYVLSMESKPEAHKEDGGYKYAKNTDTRGWEKGSSGKSYKQYIDGYIGGKSTGVFDRKTHQYSPFDVALRQSNHYYSQEDIPSFTKDSVPDYIKIAYNNPRDVSPLDLTAEQTLNLFLINIFYKSRANKSNRNQIMSLLLGNQSGLRRIYEDIHHGSDKKGKTNEATERLTTQKTILFASLLK